MAILQLQAFDASSFTDIAKETADALRWVVVDDATNSLTLEIESTFERMFRRSYRQIPVMVTEIKARHIGIYLNRLPFKIVVSNDVIIVIISVAINKSSQECKLSSIVNINSRSIIIVHGKADGIA